MQRAWCIPPILLEQSTLFRLEESESPAGGDENVLQMSDCKEEFATKQKVARETRAAN